MRWLKNVWLDVLITLAIGAALIYPHQGLILGLSIYAGFILLVKLFALQSPALLRMAARQGKNPPSALLHSLYFLNVLFSALALRWLWVAMWLSIWALSFYGLKKATRLSSPPSGAARVRKNNRARKGKKRTSARK